MMTLEERAYVQHLENTIKELKGIIAMQAKTIAEQAEKISEQAAQIAELTRRLNMNSTNSSKPSSTDGFKKKTRSLRKPSGKKAGGQKGHKGTTLELPCAPSKTVLCNPQECVGCASFDQCQGKKAERRYEIDVLIRPKVREYIQMEYFCPKSGKTLCGEFPSHITATKQYGSQLRGMIVTLNAECAVSVNKIHHLLKALLNLPVSTGFICGAVKAYAGTLQPAMESIRAHLQPCDVVNSDETGARVDGRLLWVHNASTDLFTYQYVSRKRGRKGMEEGGFLPGYRGILIHDCWKAYWAFPAEKHGLCLAHILRELQGILDNAPTQTWAQDLIDLLLRMKATKERLLAEGKECASRYYKDKFMFRWKARIQRGQRMNPLALGAKGNWIRNRARCLLDRLEEHTEEFLLFFHDFRVPFDNNQAERDVRPFKVKLKMAGCFRTFDGAQDFAKIHSVLSTITKHGMNVYETVVAMLKQPGYIPWETAAE